jgi:CTP:molybdopterin cytidylyltransferase MocA
VNVAIHSSSSPNRAAFARLAALRGERGARALLRDPEVAALDWPDGAIDIDTPGDYDRLDQNAPGDLPAHDRNAR